MLTLMCLTQRQGLSETRCTRRDQARLQDGAQTLLTRMRHGVTETTTFVQSDRQLLASRSCLFFHPQVEPQDECGPSTQ